MAVAGPAPVTVARGDPDVVAAAVPAAGAFIKLSSSLDKFDGVFAKEDFASATVACGGPDVTENSAICTACSWPTGG
jgi:hypothetical protein